MQVLSVLGATGSIGKSTLDVVRRHPERFRVFGLSACRSVVEMASLCREFKPAYAVMADDQAASELAEALQDLPATEVLSGDSGLCQIAADPAVTTVMAAIVGAAGLRSTLAAAEAGKKLLLANKEALVMSGALLMNAVRANGATLLPIDSEHNAIFQCLPAGYGTLQSAGVRRVLLTASGGPFRTWSGESLQAVTPEQACAHPNWSMGRKISVDSATLMNKGLELIEACWLFDCEPKQVEVHVHPESIIHSMVEYVDGSVLAQLGSPDMRTPIAHGLAWPERIDSGVSPLNLFDIGRFHFEKPDIVRFPCLRLAAEAFEAGGTAPAALNAANEEAVAAFLDQRIRFTDIPTVIDSVLTVHEAASVSDLDSLLASDEQARALARERIGRLSV